MRLNTIAAVLLALLLTGTVSSGAASTLTISGTGTPSFVLDEPPWDTLGLFQGDSFTYEIVLDTSVAPSDVGSSTGPGFYGAVQSFIIDGVPFEPVTNPAPDNTDNRVLFFQQEPIAPIPGLPPFPQPTQSQLIINLVNDARTVSYTFNGVIPVAQFFGSGPYSLEQIASLQASDFQNFSVDALSLQRLTFAVGAGSTFSTQAVPLPAGGVLLMGALGVMVVSLRSRHAATGREHER
ncbi:MAG: VPLPA-CTERM sorting domain-containing protein [Pseudomonadota bacterium]